jgi:endothelin-converting enzyme/putative endopeptidase
VAEKLDDEARANVRKIIEDAAAAKAAAGHGGAEDRRLLRVVHGHARIEAAASDALKADSIDIAAAKTHGELSRALRRAGFQSPVGVYIGPDDKNPDAYFVNLVQSGPGAAGSRLTT